MQTRTAGHASPRAELDRHLTAMRDDLLRLGGRVDTAIDRAMTALLHHDRSLAREVLEADGTINTRRYQLEEACLVLIATQQPVASDLRRTLATMHIAGDLERMGDHAAGIAYITTQLDAQARLPLDNFGRMAEAVRRMLRNSLYAFTYGDLEQANRVVAMDDQIDQFYQLNVRNLLTYMMEDRRIVPEATYLLWVSHNLERIGDHCVNVSERTLPR